MQLRELISLIHCSIIRVYDFETEELIHTLDSYDLTIQQYERCEVDMIINNEQSIDVYISLD